MLGSAERSTRAPYPKGDLAASCGTRRAALASLVSNRAEESRMSWETPIIEEIAVSLEVTGYAPAEEDEDEF
jgi:coenzyme PQQ precursor peptide PqqA